MPDSSSSSPDTTAPQVSDNSGLPDTFTIYLTPDEFIEIYAAAIRFASAPVGADTVDVSFSPDHRRWWFSESNVNGYLQYPADEDDEFVGAITLPIYVLQAIADSKLSADESDVELNIDTVQKTITYTSNQCTLTVPLPHQRLACIAEVPTRTQRIIVQTPHLAQLGALLTQIPVYLPDELDQTMETEFPFINFSYDGTDLRITRDWSRFHGPVLSMTIPAGGDYRGSFSVYGAIIAREFAQIDTYSHGAFTIEFNEDHPSVCHMTCANFGMVVEMGHEYVFRSRLGLEMALLCADAEFEVQRDTRIGWNPVVTLQAGTRAVTATITPDESGEAKYIRLNTDIISDLEWSPALAAEINAWNDQWPAVKLLCTDGVLHAVADVPMGALSSVSEAVVGLVAKAQIVDEVIAAVL